MIKELIKSIAFDEISLTKALTRAKLIAYKIQNETFKLWINNELEGYPSKKDSPLYRTLEVETVGSVVDMFGREYEVQIGITEQTKKQFDINFYKWHALESVAMIETMLGEISGNFVYTQLGPDATDFVKQFIILSPGVTLKNLYKKIGISIYFDIVNKTKQKLLDTLLELDAEFPNLENDFGTMKEKSKANQIITNNIYGNVSNTNFGIGENVTQEQVINLNQFNEVINRLRDLGIPDNDIENFQEIVKTEDKKEALHKKLLKWTGDIAKKSIEKGIELKIPEIIEAIQNLM